MTRNESCCMYRKYAEGLPPPPALAYQLGDMKEYMAKTKADIEG